MEFRTVFASLSAVMLGTFLVVFALIFENAFFLAVSETLPLMVLSAIAEEALKFAALFALFFFLGSPNRYECAFLGAALGFGYGMSENIIFTNILMQFLSEFPLVALRSFSTLPMHIISAGILGFAVFKSRDGSMFVPLGFLAAVSIHICFNLLLVHAL